MTKNIYWKIFVRALIEFGPPTIIGAIWAYNNYTPGLKFADSVTHFSAAFVPDRQISRIRLSDKTSRLRFRVQRRPQFLNTLRS
jgi:hypothetical protein